LASPFFDDRLSAHDTKSSTCEFKWLTLSRNGGILHLSRLGAQPDNIIRMQTATYLDRAAVEPLAPGLLPEFGEDVGVDRVKQYIGHVVRQTMEACGYHLERQSMRISRDKLFTSASRYRSDAERTMPDKGSFGYIEQGRRVRHDSAAFSSQAASGCGCGRSAALVAFASGRS